MIDLELFIIITEYISNIYFKLINISIFNKL